MKKITLLFYCVLSLVFTTGVVAQTLNQNAGWPNANWTVSGSFTDDSAADPASQIFEADPRVTANFAYDDDDAGNGSDDDINAASPVIDLTAASTAGETWLTVTTNYVFRFFNEDETLLLEYYDADAASWTLWQEILPTVSSGAPTNDFCSGTPVALTSNPLDIAGFSATQLSDFQYRIAFDDGPVGTPGWVYGFCFQAPTITSATPPACPDPTALTATPTAFDMADIAWSESGSASSWDLELVDITAAGTATGTATQTGVTNPYTLTGLDAGNDYEVYVRADCGSNWVGPVAFTTPVACDVIPSAPLIDDLTDISIDFSWDAPATGTPAGYNWEIVEDNTGQGGTILASGFTATPNVSSGNVLTANTPYDVFIQTDCGANGTSVWDGPYGFTTQPGPAPANDDCDGAISITQETNIVDASGAIANPGTIVGATASDVAAEECNEFTGNANDDVWYSFVALTTNVTITYEITGFDGVVQLYSGACGALTVVDCADSTVTTAPIVEEITATGLTVGDTYYTRIYQWNASGTAGKTFDLKIWSPDTLSAEAFEDENTFSYFPNPVKNELTLKAQNNIQNVSIYNMLGQEVLRTAPNSIESNVNMNSLAQGAYFVKVTINNVTDTIKIIKQ